MACVCGFEHLLKTPRRWQILLVDNMQPCAQAFWQGGLHNSLAIA